MFALFVTLSTLPESVDNLDLVYLSIHLSIYLSISIYIYIYREREREREREIEIDFVFLWGDKERAQV